MNRINTPLFFVIPVLVMLFSACGLSKSDKKITIAAASNMQFAIQELANTFTEETRIECEVIIGSSGKLMAQILEGAPYDLLLSADLKYPEKIEQEGLGQNGPNVYAYGKLVLWSIKEELKPSIGLLTTDSIKHIALANPKTAPYGEAAIDVLNHYNLRDSLDHKLVYGESISQTNQFIMSGSAEIGFTAMSVVLSPQLKEKGRWVEISQDHYPPIEQSVVVIRRDEGNFEDASTFYDFLFSPEAKLILKKFGYSVDE